jgi:hypothetical protein
VLAEILDEAVRCGARQVAFDVLFESSKADDPADAARDATFARSVAAAAAAGTSVLLPVSLDFDAPADDSLPARAIDALTADLARSPADVAAALGVTPDALRPHYGKALAAATAAVAWHVVRNTDWDDDRAVRHYLPRSSEVKTPDSRRLRDALRRARVRQTVESRAPPAGGHDGLLAGVLADLPPAGLAAAATHFAYVDYLPAPDGRVRQVPLVVRTGDRLVPQFGLAMTAMRLGVDVRDPSQFTVDSTRSPSARPAVPTRSACRCVPRKAPTRRARWPR